MFITDDEVIDVIVYYRQVGRVYLSYKESDFNENIKEEDKVKYKKLTVSMRILTWGLYNELQDAAWLRDENMEKSTWSNKKYKEEKLKKIIVKWDATMKNKKGEEIPAPINSNTIMSMSPNIAETILSAYDERSIFSEEELKK